MARLKRSATAKPKAKTASKPRTSRTPKKDAREANQEVTFFEALAEGLSVTGACERAGIGRTTVYGRRDVDDDFAKAWDDAIEAGTHRLEDEAHRRAFKGVTKPIYQSGRKVGSVQEYSDTLTIFLLKARDPEKFRERHDHTVKGEMSITDAKSKIADVANRLAKAGGS